MTTITTRDAARSTHTDAAREYAVRWAAHLAERLLDECERQNLSPADLMRATGHPRAVVALLRTPERLTLDEVGRAAESLGLDLFALMFSAFDDAGPQPAVTVGGAR